jgi:hypothetical protein
MKEMVGLGRVELPTSRLSGVRSNHLSYRPGAHFMPQHIHLCKGFKERETKVAVFRQMLLMPKHRSLMSNENSITGIEIQLYEFILRKEVIQPQVPLRLPCYDFTPVADLTVAGCFLAVSAPSSGKANSHGVTGGVYKARERIHRGMLIRDY